MLEFLGPILGGMGQLAGGIAGATRQSPGTDWTQIQLQREFFQKNQELQREFAQNGIRWKVEDAKAAGLHPLAAIGGAGASYSPTAYVPGDSGNRGGPDLSSALANMGQGLGRAVAATQTPAERQLSAYETARQEQQLKIGEQQIALNEMNLTKAASSLAITHQPGNGPGLPNNTPGFTVKPAEVTATGQPGHTAMPAQGNPLGTVYVDPHSGRTTLPQKDVNIDEVSSPGWSSFMYTNRVIPFIRQLTGGEQPTRPPPEHLPPGATGWHFAFPGRWIPTYPTYNNSGHLTHSQKYAGPRASTYRMGPSGAERY